MPNFTAAQVRQNVVRATEECFGEDDAGGWYAVEDGNFPVVASAAWAENGTQHWYAFGRIANNLRVDVELSGFAAADAMEVEVWAQQTNVGGGGVRIFQGTLTIPAAPPLPTINGAWFTLGACTGPRSEGWGVRARLTVGTPATTKRARFRLVGDVCASAPGVSVRGEFVT